MIVLLVVSTMAVALAGLSGANLQIADNQRHGNQAFAGAESGLDVMRYWLARLRMPSSTPVTEYLNEAIARVRADLLANTGTNFVVNNGGSIPAVSLDSQADRHFHGRWSMLAGDPTVLKAAVIRGQVGSSILAPGFGVSFPGNFSSVNGVLAANDLYFSGNASAVVKGTMISYSSNPTRVEGNISMDFDRASAVEIPAGFDLLRVLEYDPASYAMAF
jgi:hypothetical protein